MSTSRRVLAIALTVLGLVFLVAGLVYVFEPAGKLPGLFPGYAAASTHHHVKHALACFALAAASWVGAWMATGPRRSAA